MAGFCYIAGKSKISLKKHENYMTSKQKNITILRANYLGGPNIWTYRPVIEAVLDIGELEQFPSNLIPGLYERLIAYLPGLIEHRCGVGERGGFLERLREGTWAGHILEHVVLELQTQAGMKTGFGQTRSTDVEGVYKMVFRTRQEQVGRAALQLGRDLLMAAINDQAFELDTKLAELRDLVDDLCLGPSTSNIVEAATDRKIPHIRLNEGNLVQLGYGAAQRRIWTAETDCTSAIAEGIASDKDLTKTLLKSAGIPIPEGSLVRSAEAAWEEAQDIGLPVVVKPYDGNHGRGVSLNLMTQAEVEAAYHLAVQKGGSSSVIVERFVVGDEHRILVVGERMVAAGKGESLWVTGDAQSGIQKLIDEQINIDPRRGTTEEFPLNVINIASPGFAEVVLELQRQGLTSDSIPEAGRKVLIQHNGNVAYDVTDLVHPDVAYLATLAARVVGLDIAGIDLVAQDISKPLAEQRGAIIEVNASPGLLAHIKPANGEGRNVGTAIVKHLFTERDSGRIQVLGVTGSQKNNLISRLLAEIIGLSGKQTGVACADGIFLNQRQLGRDEGVSFAAGQRLLINRNIEVAVFQNTPRQILEQGLVYDRCDIGIVTDMVSTDGYQDHYLSSAEHMRKVLRTQVDVVLQHGCAVLNADDEQVATLAEYSDGAVIFYAENEQNERLQQHRQNAARVVFLREGVVVMAEGVRELQPISMQAVADMEAGEASVVLPAVAAAWALQIDPDLIEAGLRAFASRL